GAGQGNIIAFNSGAGVFVEGNSSGNAILSNSIFSNTGLGIDLAPAGVTPNDPCDVDSGPNHLQNFPILASAFNGGGGIPLAGTLNRTGGHTFRIEFFSNSVCHLSGDGEGKTLLGSTVVTSVGDCSISFAFVASPNLLSGRFVTATATDVTPSTPNLNDTSE